MQHLNFDLTYVPRGYTYYDKKIRIDRNPIRTALNVCKQLISKKVRKVDIDTNTNIYMSLKWKPKLEVASWKQKDTHTKW